MAKTRKMLTANKHQLRYSAKFTGKINIIVIPVGNYVNSLNNKIYVQTLAFCNTVIFYGVRFIAEMEFIES